MTEQEMRNILRMMTYPEWASFQKYIESLEEMAITSFKKSDSEKILFKQQGVLQTTDKILGLKEYIKGNLSNA